MPVSKKNKKRTKWQSIDSAIQFEASQSLSEPAAKQEEPPDAVVDGRDPTRATTNAADLLPSIVVTPSSDPDFDAAAVPDDTRSSSLYLSAF